MGAPLLRASCGAQVIGEPGSNEVTAAIVPAHEGTADLADAGVVALVAQLDAALRPIRPPVLAVGSVVGSARYGSQAQAAADSSLEGRAVVLSEAAPGGSKKRLASGVVADLIAAAWRCVAAPKS